MHNLHARRWSRILVLGASFALVVYPSWTQEEEAATGHHQDDAYFTLFEEVEVKERSTELVGVVDSATEGATGRADLTKRPLLRPGELLETVPGLVITQHSGAGKANQYFLRGFNLDHGTDFRVTAGGVPVNLPTHGHGQGYTDLSFLIPELVERVEFKKGPYFADEGDFSAAGASHIEFVDALPRGLLKLDGGENGYGRLVVADSTHLEGGSLLGAVELGMNDGPWQRPEDLERLATLVRFSKTDGARSFSLTTQGYGSAWNATDQIPRRAVESGQLDEFGNLDASDGGEARRMALAAEASRAVDSRQDRLTAYAVYSDLDLFSNFTYFLDDPENGDQFEQKDRRLVAGLTAKRRWSATWGRRPVEHLAGFDLRADQIENGLYSTRRRQRLSTTREDEVLQVNPALFWETRTRWSPKVRSVLGLRGDGLWIDVASDLEANSDREEDVQLSPKASLVFGPWSNTELYVNAGYGFHSNDGRGATIRVDPKTGEAAGRVPPLVRARGADLGVRTERVENLVVTASVFALELDSEIVFVGDAGTTEAGRPSRRTGVEITTFYQPRPWLAFDLDLTLTRGRFSDNDPAGDHIPGAMERVVAAGVSFDNSKRLSAALRLRHFGPRPLVEDNSVRSGSSTTLNLELGYRFDNGLKLGLQLFNLTDERQSDIDYLYESRLPGEPASGVADVHYHPAEPRTVRVSMQWGF